jgi:hypothetical protein
VSSFRLLTFAHRGEARSFLNEFSCKPTPYKENLFFNGELYILISGEGPHKAMTELAISLGLIKALHPGGEISVTNLGICGALETGFEVGEIREIRTIYSTSLSEAMEFKSFTSDLPKETNKVDRVDIVTAHKRVVDLETKERLSNFAPLVDREAWGFAFACQSAGVSFTCFKLISDLAEGEICQVVKEQADEWSELLLEKYLTMSNDPRVNDARDLPYQLNELHITLSQRRRLHHLFRALELKGIEAQEALINCDFSELIKQKKRSKEITKELTQKLHSLVYPLNTALESSLSAQTEVLRKSGLQVRFDQDLEREILHLSLTACSAHEMKIASEALGSFDFEKYISILRGQSVQ